VSDGCDKMSMFLRADEIREMTQRMHHKAQAAALNALGIVHKLRADGSPLVLRAHVEEALGMRRGTRKSKEPEINWTAINTSPKKR
jgi:hypothetical protein